MIKLKKILATGLVGLFAFSAVGCNMIQKTPEAIKNTVVAKVGDAKVTKGEVDELMQQVESNFKQQYGEDYANNEAAKEQLKQYRKRALDSLVEQKIIQKRADELGVAPSDEDAKQEATKYIEEIKTNIGGEEAFNNALEQAGMKLEEYTEKVTKDMKLKIMGEKVTEDIFKDISVTDDDIKAYYEEHKGEYGEANVAHILVKDEAKAKEVREKAANGGDFAALAKEYSEDPGSKEKGGDYGVIPYNTTKYDKDFVEGFKALKEGEISQPVKTQFGFHIIKATKVKQKTFDEVKEEIKNSLETQKKQEAYTKAMEQFKKDYKVKLYEDKL